MSLLSDILQFNEKFVAEEKYEQFETSKYPDKRMVILTCMDTRLQELLPYAMNLKNGDAKVLRNAGAMITSPFGSIMRSILVAIYSLNADEVFIIGHHDCGMSKLNSDEITEKIKASGITEETLETLTSAGISVRKWFKGFQNVEESVLHSVNVVRKHPLVPKDVPVHGLVVDPATGKLDLIVDGYEHIANE